ncbi:MAG TPA: hypothetical protein VJ801_10605, partial [Polyangia bacterium]|nr:hypothetical protein [Polyangia bacterium]
MRKKLVDSVVRPDLSLAKCHQLHIIWLSTDSPELVHGGLDYVSGEVREGVALGFFHKLILAQQSLCANMSETVTPLEIRVEGGAKKTHDDPSTDGYHSGGRGGPQGTPAA